jgi:hypothetical protein
MLVSNAGVGMPTKRFFDGIHSNDARFHWMRPERLFSVFFDWNFSANRA